MMRVVLNLWLGLGRLKESEDSGQTAAPAMSGDHPLHADTPLAGPGSHFGMHEFR